MGKLTVISIFNPLHARLKAYCKRNGDLKLQVVASEAVEKYLNEKEGENAEEKKD